MSGLWNLEPSTVATLWTAGIAILAATSCALIGGYLVLRRMGLLGDAISHAVLPGLVIGFILSGSRSPWPMMIGAAGAGLLTTFLSELLRRRARLEATAGMGIVFTSLFALGVLLISAYSGTRNVDLDASCVLYGALENAALNTAPVLGVEVPRSFVTLSVVLAINLVLVLVLWKELKISSFDPALATTLGFSATLLHYLLMAMVACTTVACFEAVGSILVIAMLIVPGATAHLLTDRLGRMLMVAVGTGWLSAIGGVWLAGVLNVSEAGMMTVVCGGLFGLAVLLSPRHGVLARMWRTTSLAIRIVQEDVLARLYRLEETAAASATRASMNRGARATSRWLAVRTLLLRGQIQQVDDAYRLTPTGRRRAQELVRSHRLWEGFLAERLGLPLDHVHEPAHRMEHYLSAELTDNLTTGIAHPDQDPHGRRIPPPPDAGQD